MIIDCKTNKIFLLLGNLIKVWEKFVKIRYWIYESMEFSTYMKIFGFTKEWRDTENNFLSIFWTNNEFLVS